MTALSNESIEARIREINDALGLLKSILAKRFEDLTLYEKLSARYLVIQLVEASASICVRILLSVYGETSEGFPHCFTRLGSKGVLPEALASRLASAARLRNLLVHRYWAISDEKVYESTRDGLKDFEEFITHVRAFLKRGR
ncbi:MAG: DUF86 domain-containing protein [Candidatus Brockarchaeota archaeon]|nr:DUF86 domain-containing protein [Candidatus Brockarchaeota archaeon]